MSDHMGPNKHSERSDRRFAVSSNRGQASHRVRYVETGGGAVDPDECTFCQAVPDLGDSIADSGKVRATQVVCAPESSEREGEASER
ncbi:hypothetical protein KUV44_00840 [Marinobacter daepoensis]|uniref:Uncharacterized protein n=1 Tax=Marinobacter daepoensis TaxID=262077 RepID=A0ABS3BAU6_9GAMM|nr:hypothetical protein [Marinobacter daepoensis]MBN7768990.1 hypothetical protein [Marinobacter daepoensis]MBY6032405.1 hypothetical protein [Marinobacter daepoensis]MBY6077680.1 hypothetical protein [Marinobacter daepoensis]